MSDEPIIGSTSWKLAQAAEEIERLGCALNVEMQTNVHMRAEIKCLQEHVATLQELRELDRVLIANLRTEVERLQAHMRALVKAGSVAEPVRATCKN